MERHTVLVVDDEAETVRSVRELLRLEYRVLGVGRAEEGMRVLAEDDVHAILTDQRMPGMTGVEFLSRVRRQHPEATRLLFTGYADVRAVIGAINEGHVYRYITKPWDAEELRLIMREACERHDLIVERRQLLERLNSSNVELARVNEELLCTDRLKTAFIEVASHELRTPLCILQCLLWTAARGRAPGLDREDLLRRMARPAQRLQHIVEQLGSMLRAGQLRSCLTLSPVDIGRLLRTAADDVSPFVAQRSQELVLELPPVPMEVPLDAEKMRDVLGHVLMNAIKFTPDGGRICLGVRLTTAGGPEIWVRDSGKGMDEATRRRIFEPFFTSFDVQHHSSGQFEYDARGLGLGLSVVKAFIELHGGQVSVASAPGQGTTLTLRLPAAGELGGPS